MNKDWTDKPPQAKFPMLLYDRVCSWLVFSVSGFTFMAAISNMRRQEDYIYAGQLFIAGLLAFIASILLENRARRS